MKIVHIYPAVFGINEAMHDGIPDLVEKGFWFKFREKPVQEHSRAHTSTRKPTHKHNARCARIQKYNVDVFSLEKR